MMTTTANNENDAAFNGLKASFTVNISDGDRAGIRLSTDAVTVAEGETGTWTVQLNTDPGANNAVKVTISSSNPDSATVDPAEITFTTDGDGATGTVSWEQAQTVTVSGETDDDISDNVVIFKHEVTSGTYAAPSRTVTVTATDTAEPALMLVNVVPATAEDSTATLSIDEGTTRYQYKVALSHRPNGTVEILMPNPDAAKLTLSTNRLVFKRDRGDWDRARNIYRCLA